ncbi:hypothetical protein OH77DRAFT_1427701 [Trametes cingulata]|nr:hypothetical protein OH77DRAFT_1427701 [Trametes cingulata]
MTSVSLAPSARENTPEPEVRGREGFRASSITQSAPTSDAVSQEKLVTAPVATEAEGEAPSARASTLGPVENSANEALDDAVGNQDDTDQEPRRSAKTPVLLLKLRRPKPPTQPRFKMEIVPETKHTTIWDGKDDEMYVWSGTLVLRDDKPPAHMHQQPIIENIAIQFRAILEPRADASLFSSELARPQYDVWSVVYDGYRISSSKGDASGRPTLNASRGIAVERGYKSAKQTDPEGPLTWRVRFWVPVPLGLFVHSEHRTFVCHATVRVEDWDTMKTEVRAEDVAVGIERLRTERLLSS